MTQNATTRGLRNPLDIIILAVANRFGEKSKEVERFLKFAVVGAFGAMVDFGTVFVLQATVLPPIEGEVWPVVVVTTIAFCAAILSNFIWNRLWTYPDSRSKSARRQLFLFAFISLVGWTVRTVWVGLAHEPLGHALMPIAEPMIQNLNPAYSASPTAEGKLGTFAALFIGVIVVMFWNFFANRYWTYNDVE